MTPRRITVFTRPDGNCIHDALSNDNAVVPTQLPSPETLWPLIQVFIQFSREVQGGAVHRLVFRNPVEYAPVVKRFHERNVPTRKHPPIVVHVAHDELFVVAVTEGAHRTMLNESDGHSISDFCEAVLDFLNTEQTAFLAMLDERVDRSAGQHSEEHDGIESPVATGFSRTESSAGESLESEDLLTMSVVRRPVVTISEGKLGDFIAKTKTGLQL